MAVNTKSIKEKSLLQHDSTDCGAACLATVIRHFGGEAEIEQIRRLSGTDQSGTTLLGLYQAAVKCGLDATGYEATLTDIKAFDGVLILHVTPEKGYNHYVVNYGWIDDQFLIWDPATGLERKTAGEIEKLWQSHKCLALSPSKEFRYSRTKRKEKRRWLIETVKPDKEVLLASVFVGILISVLGVVMAVFTQKLLDRILPSGEIKLLSITAILVLFLLAVRVILSAIRQYMLLSQGRMFNIRVVDSFYASLLELPKMFFDSRKTGDMVARLNDTMRIQRVISDIVSIYIIDVLVLVITLGMVFWYSYVAGIMSLLFLPFLYLLVYRWNGRIINSQRELMAGYALNEGNFINTLRGITEIKSMRWQKKYSARNHAVFTAFQDRAFEVGKIKVKLGMLTGLAGTLYLMGLLLYTSVRVMRSVMTQGELMAILSLSSSLIPSVMNLALLSIPLNEARVAIERMFEFTQISPEKDLDADENMDVLVSRVSLKNISFRFPGQKRLFSEVSIDLEIGKVVALVGESGSGKSTIVNILMRFYAPESGCITFNSDIDCGKLTLDKWRSSIGLVPQDVHLFNGTVLENIIPESDKEQTDRLIRMTNDYSLGPFIESLPLGLATITGEEGVKLSGGQRQIIAFMRALINEPRILLIDEGTSGMDRDTEALILGILDRLKGRTGVLLVTHRINVIRRFCDRIYILEGGVISAAGTHDDLMSGENIYKRYWDDFRSGVSPLRG